MKQIYCILAGLFLVGCSHSTKKLTETEQANYLKLGDSIATQTQKVLLMNVAGKIKEGGAPLAVNFCSEKAVFLTDSLSRKHQIQRVSDKNRNPNNSLHSELDKKAWTEISALMSDASKEKHLVLQEGNDVYYYKAIPLAMPTCLACHGNKQTDITPETLQIISEKYPHDKATDYKMGELRGLWKIKFND